MQADGVNRGVGLRVEFSANEIALSVANERARFVIDDIAPV